MQIILSLIKVCAGAIMEARWRSFVVHSMVVSTRAHVKHQNRVRAKLCEAAARAATGGKREPLAERRPSVFVRGFMLMKAEYYAPRSRHRNVFMNH